ncbi:MAG: hypothetical protein ABIT09_07080 [Croceibacterium sp.]
MRLLVDQVSNIRLWPSPREEHRGDARQAERPHGAVDAMRILLLIVVMALGACSSTEASKAAAQCELDADSPAGLSFRKSEMGTDFNRYTKSYDYNVFVIKCMQAKGYSFPKEGEVDYDACWTKNVGGGGVRDPSVEAASCYKKN